VTAPAKPKGRIKQAFFKRNFPSGMSVEDMCREAARLGVAGMEYMAPNEWPIVKQFGLVPSCGVGGGISFQTGIIQPALHEKLAQSLASYVDVCAAGGCPNIAIVGGQRGGMSYSEGANNAVAFFNRVKGHAEEKGVSLVIEIMNSKYADPRLGRAGQICDHLDWAVDVCSRVNSPRVKILFDIYHVQIMDGNIVANIRSAYPWIGHFHTGGVPDRHEIDETQELNYSFILKAVADLGFNDFVAHEYDPAPGRDPIQSLEKVFAVANV
jgi:hydroxypyruvate isomerase